VSTPVNPQIYLLKTRTPVKIGTITANNTPVQFGVAETASYRGQLIIVVPSGATIVTAQLSASIDGGLFGGSGNSWFQISPATTFTAGGFTGDNSVVFGARYDVSGMSGGVFAFGFTASTGLTSCSVWALIG
jgi:hypothetical protein